MSKASEYAARVAAARFPPPTFRRNYPADVLAKSEAEGKYVEADVARSGDLRVFGLTVPAAMVGDFVAWLTDTFGPFPAVDSRSAAADPPAEGVDA